MRSVTQLNILLVFHLVMLLASLTPLVTSADASTVTPAGDCAVFYSQGEVRVCIPELYSVNRTVFYVVARWVDRRQVEFSIGLSQNVVDGVNASVEFFDGNMNLLDTYTIILIPGNITRFSYVISGNVSVLVYRVRVVDDEVMGALIPPGDVEIPLLPGFTSPVVLALVAMLPVSLFLSYFLTHNLKEAALLVFSSLFGIYILVSYISSGMVVQFISMLLGLALIYGIIYYIVHR